MILKDLQDDDKGGWPDDKDDLDDCKVGLTWMICQMMIIDKKGGWPASRPRGKGPQAASQPNTQVLTRPSTGGADTEQYTQYTELGVNTTPTDEHYQHKSNTMVSEYYIYQDRPFLMHKTTRMPESKAIDHLNHTHVLLSNTNNRECFDPSDSQYKRRTKQYNVACCHRLWPHLPRETTGIPAHWLSFISAVEIFMGNYNIF